MSQSFIFTYRISLGNWDAASLIYNDEDAFETMYTEYFIRAMFVLATLSLTVIMLNFLVAVIGESYTTVDG